MLESPWLVSRCLVSLFLTQQFTMHDYFLILATYFMTTWLSRHFWPLVLFHRKIFVLLSILLENQLWAHSVSSLMTILAVSSKAEKTKILTTTTVIRQQFAAFIAAKYLPLQLTQMGGKSLFESVAYWALLNYLLQPTSALYPHLLTKW